LAQLEKRTVARIAAYSDFFIIRYFLNCKNTYYLFNYKEYFLFL
jgi:hypothetical protein